MNVFDLFSRAGLSVDPAAVEALGWTLLHFLWQGAIVAALLALLDTLLARRRPQLRYAAACGALVVMLVLPIATFVAVHDPGVGERYSVPRLGSHAASAAPTRVVTKDLALLASRPPVRLRQTASSWLVTFRSMPERVSVARWMPWFVALWAVGVVLLTLRLLGGWWLVTRLGRSSHNVPIEAWQTTVNGLARRMGVTRAVRLVRSGLVSVPTAIGWLRPMILLPASTLTGLSPAQIEAILAHELAHVRRHDYLVNLLQSAIETLLFYHPAVWWVSRRIREERELCCDDLAVRTSGDAVDYARALCQLEDLRAETPSMALAASGGSLVTRIARLLGASERSHVDASRGLAWALVAFLVLIGGAAGGAVRVPSLAPMAPATPLALAAQLAAPIVERLSTPEVPEAPEAPEVPEVPIAPVLAAVDQVIDLTNVVVEGLGLLAPEAPVACEESNKPEAASAAIEAVAPEAAEEESWSPSSSDKSDRFTAEEWDRLGSVGVTQRYVNNLARAGYRDLSVDQLVKLAQHGVTSAYARAIRRQLGDPTVDDLVKLAQHGIMSSYVTKMRRSLGNVSVDDLCRLANQGISSEYVVGMEELDLGDLSVDDLIRLANAGVTLEWFSSLRWMGYTDVTVDQAIQLRNSGVTPDYAASLRTLNHDLLSLDELRTLQNQGVDVQYAASLLGLLRKDLTVDQLVRLRQQGVTVSYVAGLKALGYSDITPEDLISLRNQGVELEYIAAMGVATSERLATRDLVRLRQNGVDPEFVSQVREAGYDASDIDGILRMRQRGIPNKKSLLP